MSDTRVTDLAASASVPVRTRILHAFIASAEQSLWAWRWRNASPSWRAAMVGRELVGNHPTDGPSQFYDLPNGGMGLMSVPDADRLPPVMVYGSRSGFDYTHELRRCAYVATEVAKRHPSVRVRIADYREPPPTPVQVVVPWRLYAELLVDAGETPEPGMERWPCGSL